MTTETEIDEVDAICSELGFCECGDPDSAIEFVRDGLQWLAEKPQYETEKQWEPLWKKWVARGESMFGSRGGMYFFLYWTHKSGFEMHGGSVPGWLEPEGEDMLRRIKALKP